MRAISILDTAIWDLNARTHQLPLHKYLGAVELESVPAYASGGYYLDGKTPAMLGEEMASYVEMGFKAVKMKGGRLSPREEEARVRAAREAIGPDIELMIDINNGWTDTTQAPLVAAKPNARYVEFFWDDQVLNFRRLIDRQLEHRNGRVMLHQTPGLGFGFDESAVAKYGQWTVIV